VLETCGILQDFPEKMGAFPRTTVPKLLSFGAGTQVWVQTSSKAVALLHMKM